MKMNGHHSAFASASTVEARGLVILMPYFEERADHGQLIRIAKGRLAKFLQEQIGDLLMNVKERLYSLEIKAEERFTGNLFLETWSNRNLDDRDRHAEYGPNPGWLLKSRADILAYYFLDTDDLILCNLFRLQQWAFIERNLYRIGSDGSFRYREVKQGKYVQLNDTWGALVPIVDLERETRCTRCKVKQLSLFDINPSTRKAHEIMVARYGAQHYRVRDFERQSGMSVS